MRFKPISTAYAKPDLGAVKHGLAQLSETHLCPEICAKRFRRRILAFAGSLLAGRQLTSIATAIRPSQRKVFVHQLGADDHRELAL